MRVIRNQVFTKGFRHNRQVIQNLRLEGCTFDGSAGFMPDWKRPDPKKRATIRNVTLKDMNALSAFLQGAIVEDVTVDTTKAGKHPLFLRGNVYKHVTLLGRIGFLEIRGKIGPPDGWPEEDQRRVNEEWDRANAEYYKGVDWAIDIRGASFGSLSISGVPTRLIRRDRKTTAVVTRKRALERKWQEIPLGAFYFNISWFLDDGYDDVVLIACPRSKNYAGDLEDLAALRKIGVAK
jgi:hypothetical protein